VSEHETKSVEGLTSTAQATVALPTEQTAPASQRCICPHCGEIFEFAALRNGALIPTHEFPRPCRAVCPGSGQVPRNPDSDKRPLWKDGGVE
jgi:hypothetical protein